jgi:hypothetical protein
LVTLWALWHARRKIIHEGQLQSLLSTHHFVEHFISELGQLAPVPVSKPARSAPGPKWIAPPVGFDKVNVDAVSKNSAMGAIAVVARSRKGTFLGASAVVLRGWQTLRLWR